MKYNEATYIFPFARDHIVTDMFALLFENLKFFSFFPSSLAQEQLGAVIAVKMSHVTRLDWDICPVQLKSLRQGAKAL